jgi:hypothetical protein
MSFLKLIAYLNVMSHRITNHKQELPFPIIFSARSQNCEKRLLALSCLSIRLFAWNIPDPTGRIFLFGYFSKIFRENWSFITIWQEQRVLCMKTNIHFWSYFAKFFSEWEMFQTNVVGKIKTHILCSITSFRKSYHSDIKLKNNVTPGRPQMTTWRMRVACWIPKAIHTHW